MSKKSTTLAAPAVRVEGMGAIPHENGVFFRVWAPHAKKVFVTGTFNNWAKNKNQLTHEGNGYWGLNVPDAAIGNEYKYVLHTDAGVLHRYDPYAREMTNSAGNSSVTDPHFEWTDHDIQMP
ncbi:MAG TPA: 1,4-alpha-glucan branching protein, partial [Niastella sp.]